MFLNPLTAFRIFISRCLCLGGREKHSNKVQRYTTEYCISTHNGIIR